MLHGDQGYSQKSDQGSASAYYSYPQLSASGELWIDAARHQVSGKAWYDHEWTSGVLAGDQVGWDWFSLRLSDGSALMLFNIRRQDGSVASRRGSLIEADGSVRALAEGDLEVRPNGHWTSPHSGVRWPLRWTLSSQSLDLSLDITPTRDDQEFDGAVRYWEGAIDASGQRDGKPVSAEGYLELTGYAPDPSYYSRSPPVAISFGIAKDPRMIPPQHAARGTAHAARRRSATWQRRSYANFAAACSQCRPSKRSIWPMCPAPSSMQRRLTLQQSGCERGW